MIFESLKVGTVVRLLGEFPPSQLGKAGVVWRVTDDSFYVQYDGISDPVSYDIRDWPKDFGVVKTEDVFDLMRRKSADPATVGLLIRVIEELAGRIRNLERDTAK